MKTWIISIKIFVILTIITGIVYPLLITGIAQWFFPWKANGSIIIKDNKAIGSELIGQEFDSAIYFSSRPSAISYNPLPSGGSNFGLTNAKLKINVDTNKKQFIENNQLEVGTDVPAEMLFASASGLDPHISKKAAVLQVNRIANARSLTANQKQQLLNLINDITEPPQFLYLGEERINVLLLNSETDNIK